MIRYARVAPDTTAGTVRVDLHPATLTPGGTSPTEARMRSAGGVRDGIVAAEERSLGTVVTVRYELTALSAEAEPALREFFAGFEGYLASWREAIGAIRSDVWPTGGSTAAGPRPVPPRGA